MSFIPKPQEIYKHFKGNLYQITAVAEHTETGELLVVYQALYGDFKTYARPLQMFTSRVDRKKYPDVAQEFRFELQRPETGYQRADSEPDEPETLETESREPQAVQAVGQWKAAHFEEPQQQTVETGTAEGTQSGLPSVQDGEELTEGELALDPMVLEFLDADGYEQRLNILAGLHHRITNDMITTMAIASDVEVGDGDVEERYEALKACLVTIQRYECTRLR